MQEIMVNIDELKPSVSNVRAKHTKEDIDMMAKSIEHRGIINPPAVAKNGDGKYEVVAGFLRTLGAAKAGIEQIRCLDVTALTPSERVEISLSENVDRREMSAIQYYAAFNQLFKSGMPVEKIGERFNKTEREVQQLLAIGSLPKKILDLAEKDEIGDRTLKVLAIAPGKDVIRYNKLKADERPNDWNIDKWLAGDEGMYRAANALFDLEKYVGPQITDLFADEDEVWLKDGAQFTMLQSEAINEIIAKHVANGWKVSKLDHWQSWAYDKTSKKNGGEVFYTRSDRTQEVNFYVGYKRQEKTGKAPKAKKETDKKEKPEISKAFADYMAELRHSAIQHKIADGDKRIGLVASLVLLLKQCDNISFGHGGGRRLTDTYEESVRLNQHSLIVSEDYKEMLNELGIGDRYAWDIKIDQIGSKLMEYTPNKLARWISLVVAANWTCDTSAGDELASVIGLKQVDLWEADQVFWDGIKNKQTLLAIAKENDITVSDKEPTKIIRKRLAEKVPNDWRPSWLKFEA
jgi:ParB family chromosome partitioning protein